MSDNASFKTSDGENGLDFFIRIEKETAPTNGDLLYAGQGLRTRMLDRTAKGLDFEGKPFAPYSTKGPYYHNPSRTTKNRGASVGRFLKKVGGAASRTRLSVKFPSYGAMKHALGRMYVDLRGVSAPHMLQALIIRVGSFVRTLSGGSPSVGLRHMAESAGDMTIGIYGDEAGRAEAHNEGAGKAPQRRFLDASDKDIDIMGDQILDRMVTRVMSK